MLKAERACAPRSSPAIERSHGPRGDHGTLKAAWPRFPPENRTVILRFAASVFLRRDDWTKGPVLRALPTDSRGRPGPPLRVIRGG